MLAQRRRRWANVVYMLYKCFVFTGMFIANCFSGVKLQNKHDVFYCSCIMQTKYINLIQKECDILPASGFGSSCVQFVSPPCIIHRIDLSCENIISEFILRCSSRRAGPEKNSVRTTHHTDKI